MAIQSQVPKSRLRLINPEVLNRQKPSLRLLSQLAILGF
ncbi:hypothetical protein GXM_00971 [Nostoc sphaeroides CCNUC1]|uniref:Uncharacterized protein n=1 Tax=Nostoc sphaeroides CCNUC1 TaxID=2653204 RepID=A0A5P8VSR5_9NOSO|nr:hypothetical protein GXM_00971 [Nostoc sphaeroides CCNUC1]